MRRMRLGLSLVLGIAVLGGPVFAQDCPAVARLQPVGFLTGTLDAKNCLLSDGSAYAPYRLDLPVRGQIRIDLSDTSAELLLMLRDASGVLLGSGLSIRRNSEAGSYTLLVGGKAPGQVGGYKVTTGFVAEPAILCANYPRIGSRQSISGVLGSSGCAAPDGSAYDGYALTTMGSGTLTVTATSSEFTPTVVLRGSDGRALATSVDGTLSTPVLGGSDYIVVVASADNKDAYQLTTAFDNDPEDSCRTRKSYSDPDKDSGVINADSCFVTVPETGDQLYYSLYNLTIAAPGVVRLSAASADFTPRLYLLDEAGNQLAVDTAGGGIDSAGNTSSALSVLLPAGNYVAQVFSDVSSGGSYQFQYGYQSANTPCIPSPTTAGDARDSVISAASCRTSLGWSDIHTFTLGSAGTLDLDLASTAFAPILAIRDARNNLIVRSGDTDGPVTAHISADLAPGVYSVVAAAGSYSGGYRLTSKFTPHDIPVCRFTQALDLNGGYIQRLSLSTCKAPNGQAVDQYGFTLAADSLVLAVMTSSEVDGHLTLYDASGSVVRTDDNSYGGIDPLIIQYLPAGTYTLAARDAFAAAGGLYEVDLRTVTGPKPPLCTSRGPLSPGGSVSGNITYTGCQYSDGTFADLYEFALSADATVDFGLTSPDFDASLIVLDAKGNVVDADDDGGGGTNARITRPLAAGTYYIVAKPSGDYLAHGTYILAAKTVE
jgi:hypothetical protein